MHNFLNKKAEQICTLLSTIRTLSRAFNFKFVVSFLLKSHGGEAFYKRKQRTYY